MNLYSYIWVSQSCKYRGITQISLWFLSFSVIFHLSLNFYIFIIFTIMYFCLYKRTLLKVWNLQHIFIMSIFLYATSYGEGKFSVIPGFWWIWNFFLGLGLIQCAKQNLWKISQKKIVNRSDVFNVEHGSQKNLSLLSKEEKFESSESVYYSNGYDLRKRVLFRRENFVEDLGCDVEKYDTVLW